MDVDWNCRRDLCASESAGRTEPTGSHSQLFESPSSPLATQAGATPSHHDCVLLDLGAATGVEREREEAVPDGYHDYSAEMPDYDLHLDTQSEFTDANYLEDCELVAKREEVYLSHTQTRGKSITAAAIKRARALGREAFSKVSYPTTVNNLKSASEPAKTTAAEAQQPTLVRLSWVKRPAAAVNQFFIDHPFWGVPADDPPAVLLRQWAQGVRVSKRRVEVEKPIDRGLSEKMGITA